MRINDEKIIPLSTLSLFSISLMAFASLATLMAHFLHSRLSTWASSSWVELLTIIRGSYTITEKAPTRAFSWLKAPTSTSSTSRGLLFISSIVKLRRCIVCSSSINVHI